DRISHPSAGADAATPTVVEGNTISGTTNGTTYGISAYGYLTIQYNTIFVVTYGVSLGSGSANTTLRGNVVSTNTTNGYGLNVTSTDVTIYDNNVSSSSVGIYVTTDRDYHNTVHHSTVGIEGSGVIGGTSWTAPGGPNDVYSNTTGVISFGNDTIQFNRIHDNTVGIKTASGDNINHNVLYRNGGQNAQGNPIGEAV